MKRFLASLTVVAFVSVMQVLPALHRIYGCPCHPHAAAVSQVRHARMIGAEPHSQADGCPSCHGCADAHDVPALEQNEDCPICHLALLPTESSSTAVSSVAAAPLFAAPAAQPARVVAAGSSHEPTQPRAPPARV